MLLAGTTKRDVSELRKGFAQLEGQGRRRVN